MEYQAGLSIFVVQFTVMADLNQPIPRYLVLKQNIVKLILFTALFALVFINIYAPFGVEYWFNAGKWGLLAYSSLIILTGVLVVVVSRIIMYHYSKRHPIKLWSYLAWVAVEVFCMALFYALFESLILKDERFFMDMLKLSIENTALVLLLPYSVLWLYFSWHDKKHKLEQLESGNFSLDAGNLVSFKDERGTLRLSVKQSDLLYIESADNYVKVYYNEHNIPTSYLLRNTLKKLEAELPEDIFIRCHRSYLINMKLINTIKREKEGVFLELDTEPVIRIPVSKTYIDNVIRRFTN
ncbi:LytR/AlgR family response regulator transcription factor [Saccharicrinis sp. FJH2]|uniref:LytR/AlgR family response regulator transcription factor n=1 Tax=Saccharicrinis sp. FJH65 TaxID=3344659 RepID=UPI0035F4C21D